MLDTSRVSRFATNGTDSSGAIPVSLMWGHPETIRYVTDEAAAPDMDRDQGAGAPETSAPEFPVLMRIATGPDRAAGSAVRRPRRNRWRFHRISD